MTCMKSDEAIAAKLEQHDIAHGSLLHIASGVPICNLTTLCSKYKCFQSGPVLQELFAGGEAPPMFSQLVGPSSCLTREVRAAVEFWTATHADTFFGNFYSSFSVELAATRVYERPLRGWAGLYVSTAACGDVMGLYKRVSCVCLLVLHTWFYKRRCFDSTCRCVEYQRFVFTLLVLANTSVCLPLRPDYAHNMHNGTSEQHVAVRYGWWRVLSCTHSITIRCKVTSNNAWHLSRYVPSAWEAEWYDNREAWTGKACAMMVKCVP